MMVATFSGLVHVFVPLAYFPILPKPIRLSLFRQAAHWSITTQNHHFEFDPPKWEQFDREVMQLYTGRLPVIRVSVWASKYAR